MLASSRVCLIVSSITLSGQTKDCKIAISCLTNRQPELRNKNKDGLDRDRDNVFQQNDARGCCFSELEH